LKTNTFLFVLFFAITNSLFCQSTIKIGKQKWAKENLAVTTFKNGDTIFQARNKYDWQKAGKEKIPAWSYNKYDITNDSAYGKYYNFYAVNDPRGLAPKGYHIPSDEEWLQLINFIGEGAGTKMKTKSGWIDNLNGTNESGFSAIPAGHCDPSGFFDNNNFDAIWWTTTRYDEERIWFCKISYDNKYIIELNHDEPDWGFSVRCIKNQ
jgi:uncharacterized protein (TIGR02145 family)